MPSLILNVAVSLDGFLSGPNGEYDWCFTDQDYGMKEFLARVDTTIMGWKTYELMAGMKDTGLPSLRYVVFSRQKRTHLREGFELATEELVPFVRRLKDRPGKDIWLFGGAEFTHACLKAGLVDEMLLAVHPILLGAGKLLFPSTDHRTKFVLGDVRSYSSGLVQLKYTLSI